MSQVTIARGRRQSTAFCYLDPARGRPNLTIEQGALARGADPGGQGAASASATRWTACMREARAAREVIVSAGSINSPKLLELSGIGQPRAAASARHHAGARAAGRRREPARPLFAAGEVRDHRAQHDLQRQCPRLAAGARGASNTRCGARASSPAPRCRSGMYFRTRPGLETPDATISVLPFLYERVGGERRIARAARHHHERQRAALGEHRLDPHQVGRSGRGTGDPLQLPLGAGTTATACLPPSARGAS